MEFTFHNSYIILEIVHSVVIFWIELSCWHKSYPNNAVLPVSWSHCCTNSTVVITIWLSVTKYPYLKWQWIFYFLRIFLLPSITVKTFTGLYIWVTRRVSYQKQELLNLRKHMSATRFLCGVFVAHLFSFSCSPIMSLYVLSYVLWCLLHFRIKAMFVLLYLHLL